MKRGNGAIRTSVSFGLLFASLSLVVWRQSRALEELRSLDTARSERTILQAERSALQREIHHLESRSRIMTAAGGGMGLRLPVADEIVFLQTPVWAAASTDDEPAVARRGLLTTAGRR